MEKTHVFARYKMNLLESLNKDNIPPHLAIIMDGNGRWAKERGAIRAFGHQNGVHAVRKTVEECAKLGVKYLTLYAFSTENWNRPKLEVDTLMKLLVKSLQKELPVLQKNGIRLNAIGDLSRLSEKTNKKLLETIAETNNNNRLTLTIALSYGSRDEIITAVKNISNKVKNNIISEDAIDELIINQHLYTHNLPDVDLLIRTSGEQRISNFLLWQIAYSELFFTEVLWPDFEEKHLHEAIHSYQKRERRFGKTSEQIK